VVARAGRFVLLGLLSGLEASAAPPTPAGPRPPQYAFFGAICGAPKADGSLSRGEKMLLERRQQALQAGR